MYVQEAKIIRKITHCSHFGFSVSFGGKTSVFTDLLKYKTKLDKTGICVGVINKHLILYFELLN